jgi:hypothetical protein
VSHADLTEISSAQQDVELQQSQEDLAELIDAPVPNFASPYGHYNGTVLNKIRQIYGSHRTVQAGFNTKQDTNVYELKVQNIYNTTTRAEVEAWLATAQAQGSWLILVYHQLTSNPDTYSTTPALFEQQLQAVQASGIAVRTLADALAEVVPQL